jgi:hypothetical protein
VQPLEAAALALLGQPAFAGRIDYSDGASSKVIRPNFPSFQSLR